MTLFSVSTSVQSVNLPGRVAAKKASAFVQSSLVLGRSRISRPSGGGARGGWDGDEDDGSVDDGDEDDGSVDKGDEDSASGWLGDGGRAGVISCRLVTCTLSFSLVT